MKPKRTLSGYVLLVGIMGLSIVGGVLAFQVYSAATKTQVTTEQSTLIKPLDGQIDPKVLSDLQKRRVFTDNQLSQQTAQQISSPQASPGGNINVAPEVSASPSATK